MSMNQQQKMQPPYIGSKISLISKLDIRYEGTLYTVDAIESTIALAKVHSYGTEDRHTPVFVPARDEIYDFIIFKASDIKDLIVCEPPKATNVNNPLASGLPYDPAIVSISKNPPPEPKLPTKLNNLSINEKHHGQQQQRPFNSFLREGTSNGLDPNAYDGTPMFNYRTSGSNNVGGRSSREALARPNNQHSFYFQPPQNPHHQQRQPLSQVVDSIQPFINNSQSQHNSQMRLKFDNDYDFEKANELFREISEELKPKMEKMDLSGKSVSVETAEKPEYAEDENTKTIESVMKDENSGTDENIAAIKMREQTVEPIEKDEFEGKMGKVEEEIMSVKGGQQEKENADFYDKSASFFDNISCDALEKEAGKNVRPDWKRERQTNQETFGHSAVRSLFYHRRGSTRGFGMAPVRFNYRFPNFQQQPRLAQQQQQQAGYRRY